MGRNHYFHPLCTTLSGPCSEGSASDYKKIYPRYTKHLFGSLFFSLKKFFQLKNYVVNLIIHRNLIFL